MLRSVRGLGRDWVSRGLLTLGASWALATNAAALPRTGGAGTGRAATGGGEAASAAYRAYVASFRNGVAATTAASTARTGAVTRGVVIPAFARKYGLRCSACHTFWPELNSFGQAFRDNGYQLMNEKDSPIWQNPSYFPATVRITPQWHWESTTNQLEDAVPGQPSSGQVSKRLDVNGFDLSGMDFWTAGTLWKNISFVVLFSSDEFASFHFESAFLRFDNLANSPWLNIKAGKFELDNLISEKRFLFLSNNGGLYQTYHFNPVGDANDFGIGDNQLGIELAGHNLGSYTRYSISVLSSSDGNPGLSTNESSYDVMAAFSQAWDAGKLGVERVGAYGYLGQRATILPTTDSVTIPGAGRGLKPFYRVGLAGDFFLKNLEFLPFFLHGYDNAYLGTATAADQPLPTGARAPTWNGGFLETHYYLNPQFVFLQRVEFIRMQQQALASTPSSLGNIDAYSFGYRWSPFMYSRAGLALHGEYSITKTVGGVPLSGDGVGLPPASPGTAVWSGSLLFALDFAF
jgi:hypothetical protein